jgi:hypothetical protein
MVRERRMFRPPTSGLLLTTKRTSIMTTDLERQNGLAKELLATLERIKAIWDELPSEDDVERAVKQAEALARSMKTAVCNWQELPTNQEIEDTVKVAAELDSAMGGGA